MGIGMRDRGIPVFFYYYNLLTARRPTFLNILLRKEKGEETIRAWSIYITERITIQQQDRRKKKKRKYDDLKEHFQFGTLEKDLPLKVCSKYTPQGQYCKGIIFVWHPSEGFANQSLFNNTIHALSGPFRGTAETVELLSIRWVVPVPAREIVAAATKGQHPRRPPG